MYRTMNSFMGKMCVRGWAIKCGMIPDGLMHYGYWFDSFMLSKGRQTSKPSCGLDCNVILRTPAEF